VVISVIAGHLDRIDVPRDSKNGSELHYLLPFFESGGQCITTQVGKLDLHWDRAQRIKDVS
jgi:hypothetical protein